MAPVRATSATTERVARDPWYLATTPLATRPWLIRMRWATAIVELSLLAVTFGAPQLDLPLDHIVWLLVADAAANAATAYWLERGHELPPLAATSALGIQILLLTALLELTGGPSNPFVVVYILQVTVAALTIGGGPARYTAKPSSVGKSAAIASWTNPVQYGVACAGIDSTDV